MVKLPKRRGKSLLLNELVYTLGKATYFSLLIFVTYTNGDFLRGVSYCKSYFSAQAVVLRTNTLREIQAFSDVRKH